MRRPLSRVARRGARAQPALPGAAGSPVELRPLRLAALALLLIAAALYVSPLRAFFAQQDSYARQVASLKQSQLQNSELLAQIAAMHTRDYVTRQAREQYQLVPAGLQAFVVKGLPGSGVSGAHDATANAGTTSAPVPTPSLLARLADLWHTIRQ